MLLFIHTPHPTPFVVVVGCFCLFVDVIFSYIVYFVRGRAQELCESGGGRPGLPSLISLRFLWR